MREAPEPARPGDPRPSAVSHAPRLALAAASQCNPTKMSSCPLGLAGCPPPLHEGRGAANRDSSGRRLGILEDAPPHPPARPRTALPSGVGYLAPATGSVKQKNFCKLSSPDTHRFLKSGPHLPRTCIPRRGRGGMVCGGRDPKVSRSSLGLGGRAERIRCLACPARAPVPGHPFLSVPPTTQQDALSRRSWE